MSRTIKDKPYKLHPNYWKNDKDTEKFQYEREYTSWGTKEKLATVRTGTIQLKTTKTKKRKEVDTEDHWMTSGPSWYKNMFMNRPQRRAGRIWEATVTRTDIEEADAPGVSRKPHPYWW